MNAAVLSYGENTPGEQLAAGAVHGRWSFGWCSRAGLRHSRLGMLSEDSVATFLPAGGGFHAVVADGVSGSDRGRIASAACATYLSKLDVAYPPAAGTDDMAYISAEQRLDENVRSADNVVEQQVQQQAPGCTGATTFSACWLDSNGCGWITRVGDCRIYFWRVQPPSTPTSLQTVDLHQPLPDQTYLELSEKSTAGIPLENPSRMCGNGHLGIPELRAVSLQVGDGLLLTSDGIHDVLSHDFIRTLLARGVSRGWSELVLAKNLERHARRLGSCDDLSVLVLRFLPGAIESRLPLEDTHPIE